MICPECGEKFRGNAYFISGERGTFRRCPNGHGFKEPKKPRSKTKEQLRELVNELRPYIQHNHDGVACAGCALDARVALALTPNAKLSTGQRREEEL